MKPLFQLLFLFFINTAFSQDYREATIIFNDSTSVKGFGEIKGNTIYFKVKEEDKPSKWSHDIAKGLLFSGYGYSEKYVYVKFEKNKDPKLMEVIEEGNITLYKDSKLIYKSNGDSRLAFGSNGLSLPIATMPMTRTTSEELKEKYYVQRKNAEFATDITFSFKFRAKIYFSDCEKVIEKINNGQFNKKNIPKMIYYYNDYCDSTENEDTN
ncbi:MULTISPECIES: hypothetical protein [unclassified Flavobacterium]|uniref:hypothetical protein n=1 Tax=unclassified Flavobacterium TaxID=196869 RepID=UPI0012A91B94|nr:MULTISPECIES: hypothetical protein [unclassified Flavobacterium]MBF4486936.1 hypothetical protein [Flavobacterium sp. CSZ]QGK75614.1 hypothetical protein GIY83_16530 [Flavobacterium sp. SLB02]